MAARNEFSKAVAITETVTMIYVALGRKKLDDQYVAHVARELAKLVESDYGGNQTRAAKALGMSQPHLSNLISGSTSRGPGLHTLLLLRAKTGRSIDALLGLPPVGEEELTERLRMTVDTEIARIKRIAREEVLAARISRAPASEPMKRAK